MEHCGRLFETKFIKTKVVFMNDSRMSDTTFKNIETYVLLDWFIKDFDSKYERYRFVGDNFLIEHTIKAAGQGRAVLARVRKPIEEISRSLGLDLIYESVPTQIFPPSGPWHNVHFLSFGFEDRRFTDAYVTQFIINSLEQKMHIESPELRFKLFYLPQLPTATSDEGHFMENIRGFTNVERRMIEINLHPPLDFDEIFGAIVHEIVHICLLKESDLDHAPEVEAKVSNSERTFLTNCHEECESHKSEINQSIKSVIDYSFPIFRKADTALNMLERDLQLGGTCVYTFLGFFDAILFERVKPVPISM